MNFNACVILLFLYITIIEAGPAPKIVEKKSLAEDVKAESKNDDLKIEETGEDKDRSKKSTFCLQIEPGASQSAQVWKENQISTQTIPLTFQAQPLSQQVQTLNVVQPTTQTLPQTSVVMPQPMVQPIHTLQIVQSPQQPCVQSTPAVNIIQSVPQSTFIKSILKPKPKPKPTVAPSTEVTPVIEKDKPMHIEQSPQPLPDPQQTLTVLPIAPTCHEHLITVPSNPMMLVAESEQPQLASFIQVPSMSPCSNPLHSFLSPCSCQQNVAMVDEPNVESIAMRVLPITSYSSTFAKSPLVMPYDSNTLSHIAGNVDTKLTPHARHHHVTLKIPHHLHPQLSQQTVYQNMYVRGLEPTVSPYVSRGLVDNTYTPQTVTINAFPQTFREANSVQQSSHRLAERLLGNEKDAVNNPSTFETNDLMQSNKATREIDSNQLLPEDTTETKQEDSRALLIDGRRNVRSSKEKTKGTEIKSKTS